MTSPSTYRSTVGSVRDADTPQRNERILAFVIDAAVAGALHLALNWVPLIGGGVGLAYLLLRDGIDLGPIQSTSIGKHVMNLRAVRMDGEPVDYAGSARRNWIFGIGLVAGLVGVVPFVGGLLETLVTLGGLAVVVYEAVQILRSDDGRHLGDRFANTRVIEG